ncbi:hypothetical protein [Armatimonas sp.]|uniref:hypothetical protein n=1 Tax=Armatimonas sp. TaxID=1872638 RepID=UPI00374CCF6E
MNPSPCPLPRTHPSAPSLRAGKGGINSPSPAHDPPCPEGGWRSEERAKPGGFEPGEFNRRIVPGWAKPASLPIKNGHGLVFDKSGYLHLLTDHADANLLVFDPATGRVVHQKNLGLTGGHGLSIVEENRRQVLYLTCLNTHRVLKTTLQGEVLAEWGWPKETGKYKSAEEYKPSWTLHLPDGSFCVLDGYGKDYVIRYDKNGNYAGYFGGNEGGIPHWGPHGGYADKDTLLIAMSDQRSIARWSVGGKKLGEWTLPGSDPRMLRPWGKLWIVGHLGGKWPQDRNVPGYVSVLDSSFKVIANIGGSKPEYDKSGKLKPMETSPDTPFRRPHDAIVGPDDSLYVGQFDSGDQPLLKLERV